MGLDPKSVNPSEIRADYEAMQAQKMILEKTYKSAEKEAKSLQQKFDNVEQYIGHEQSAILEQPTNTHSHLSNESRS